MLVTTLRPITRVLFACLHVTTSFRKVYLSHCQLIKWFALHFETILNSKIRIAQLFWDKLIY